ncbi:MAG: HAMP domain-containing protein, partial [Oscillibacter sp.]|nr:HAMP domain-containing protein [Oscillibacter sp.]
MFRSLRMKLTMIMLMLMGSQMAIVGTFLTTGVSSFYMNNFYRQLDSVFGLDQREFVSDLRNAADDDNGAESLREMLDANAGPLGIDYHTRNYFVLDGETGAWLAGSASADALPMEQSLNLLTARTAVARGDSSVVGDDSYLNAEYMDAAIPILSGEHSYIIYILDNQETLTGLNQQLFHIILQSLILGLLITALLSFLLAKTMVGPLEKLTAGAEEVAAGKFGTALPVESTDEIGTLTGTFNEMAGVLHTTLAAMENERNKLDTLFLYMTDGVVAFDMSGAVIHCNPAATNMLQRKVEIGSRYDDLFGGLFAFGDMLALKRPSHAEGEMMVGERTLELLLAPFSHQELGGVLAVLHDVTERHRNEERRKEFVANVSHELRTPLTNVRSYAETLRDADGEIPPDMSNNFLDIIINETDRMTHIVQDLLILSRLDAGNTEIAFTRFPFGEAIESVVRANALNARARNHELTFHAEEELPCIEGDRNRLEQVMMNIIGNAIKYTPDGGHIRVTAGLTGDRQQVWMDVWDDGIGIPEESRARV